MEQNVPILSTSREHFVPLLPTADNRGPEERVQNGPLLPTSSVHFGHLKTYDNRGQPKKELVQNGPLLPTSREHFVPLKTADNRQKKQGARTDLTLEQNVPRSDLTFVQNGQRSSTADNRGPEVGEQNVPLLSTTDNRGPEVGVQNGHLLPISRVQNGPLKTSEKLGKQFGVSASTIKRDAADAKLFDDYPEQAAKIISGELTKGQAIKEIRENILMQYTLI